MFTYRTVCSAAAGLCLRTAARRVCSLLQVVEMWNQFQTASVLKIRVSVVRFRPWPPPYCHPAVQCEFGWARPHTDTRYSSAAYLAMLGHCCTSALQPAPL